MGFFSGLFEKKSDPANVAQDTERYRELLRFIAFSQKIKPLVGGNYGIFITYEAPRQNEFASQLYATFGFYNFNHVKYARGFVNKSSQDSTMMAKFYYNEISKQADLCRQDWPYGIDACDFLNVLRGTFCQSYFILNPDDHDDDIFSFKVVGGVDFRNATQVSNAVINVLKTKFPTLQISKNHTSLSSMGIKVQI